MRAELAVSKIFCDFIILSVIAVPLLIFHEYVQPFKRGFFCDDETIRYPYRPSTVPRQLLIVIGILIPTFLIIITEMFRSMHLEKRIAGEFNNYRLKRYNIHRFVVRLYVFIGYFIVGVCFNQLMVDIGKYTIGRLRPHFMDVCRPDFGYDNCPNDHKYINVTEFRCTGTNAFLIHESRLSFYSGHSAFSFYAAWYTSFYLQARLYQPLVSRLVLPVIQFSLFAGASFVAYTRVSDFKHHWSDVSMGIIMGSIIGIVNAIYIAEVFSRREVPRKYRHKDRLLAQTDSSTAVHYDPAKQECSYVGQQHHDNNLDVECGLPSSLSGGRLPAPSGLQRVVVHEERVSSVMHPTYG